MWKGGKGKWLSKVLDINIEDSKACCVCDLNMGYFYLGHRCYRVNVDEAIGNQPKIIVSHDSKTLTLRKASEYVFTPRKLQCITYLDFSKRKRY